MNQDYNKQRSAFAQFLRQGLSDLVIPGGFTFEQIVKKFNLPKNLEFPGDRVTCAWFQDLNFVFDDHHLLAWIGVVLKPITEYDKTLPKVLNLQWEEFASQLVPETFESLILTEQIPCLKATKILDEEIFPPIYCLDHIGIMPRFEDEGRHNLYCLGISLLRTFPRLQYEMLWPRHTPGHVSDWPSFVG